MRESNRTRPAYRRKRRSRRRQQTRQDRIGPQNRHACLVIGPIVSFLAALAHILGEIFVVLLLSQH